MQLLMMLDDRARLFTHRVCVFRPTFGFLVPAFHPLTCFSHHMQQLFTRGRTVHGVCLRARGRVCGGRACLHTSRLWRGAACWDRCGAVGLPLSGPNAQVGLSCRRPRLNEAKVRGRAVLPVVISLKVTKLCVFFFFVTFKHTK